MLCFRRGRHAQVLVALTTALTSVCEIGCEFTKSAVEIAFISVDGSVTSDCPFSSMFHVYYKPTLEDIVFESRILKAHWSSNYFSIGGGANCK